MSILAQVGELDDGGYWYAAPAVILEGGIGFSSPLDLPFCAQYGQVEGIWYAVMRINSPTTLPQYDVDPAAVIDAAVSAGNLPSLEKFYARVGGR